MEGEGNSRVRGRREDGNACHAARSLVISYPDLPRPRERRLDDEIWVRDKIARKEVIAVRQDTPLVSRPTSK